MNGISIDKDHRSSRDDVPIDFAVGGYLVWKSHRCSRVEVQMLGSMITSLCVTVDPGRLLSFLYCGASASLDADAAV